MRAANFGWSVFKSLLIKKAGRTPPPDLRAPSVRFCRKAVSRVRPTNPPVPAAPRASCHCTGSSSDRTLLCRVARTAERLPWSTPVLAVASCDPYPLPERGLLLIHNRALLLTSATDCGWKPLRPQSAPAADIAGALPQRPLSARPCHSDRCSSCPKAVVPGPTVRRNRRLDAPGANPLSEPKCCGQVSPGRRGSELRMARRISRRAKVGRAIRRAEVGALPDFVPRRNSTALTETAPEGGEWAH